MRFIVPYTNLNPATELAMGEYPTEFIEVDSGEGYFRLLYHLWKDGQSFIVVEHDVVPWPGALHELANCEQELCGFQTPISFRDVPYRQMIYHSGPVKFSASLMEKYPDHMENATPQQRDWRNCIEWVFNRLGPLHIHTPPVTHLNSFRMSMNWDSYCQWRKETTINEQWERSKTRSEQEQRPVG